MDSADDLQLGFDTSDRAAELALAYSEPRRRARAHRNLRGELVVFPPPGSPAEQVLSLTQLAHQTATVDDNAPEEGS